MIGIQSAIVDTARAVCALSGARDYAIKARVREIKFTTDLRKIVYLERGRLKARRANSPRGEIDSGSPGESADERSAGGQSTERPIARGRVTLSRQGVVTRWYFSRRFRHFTSNIRLSL